MDTDRIRFVPPPGVDAEKKAENSVGPVSNSLPEGIELGMDGLYPARLIDIMMGWRLSGFNVYGGPRIYRISDRIAATSMNAL